ncbi:hypothetical protein LEL_08722 [Akanthomyces lecanii RCEF 1005]|uniref:Uncharacterized protein n=1 Tax=Akanthomyces lecanii RCEF 1005 TaxID=1081108 RepID=A0A168DS28_CORDF|nr:hypothetical protein LEL_08722 [Akanthomyces lecanii RCEF 1005]
MGRLEPLLKGLECYGKVVDTLCQSTPFLPWIWAPIVTILKIGSDCINAFETLIRAYAKIGQSLTRSERLRRTFDNDAAFQDIVAVFYRDIHNLAHELREVQMESGVQNELMHKGLHVSDTRAEYLQSHPAILPAIQAALVSQTEVLDPSSNIATSSPCQVNANDDGVAVILKQYQRAVLWVLAQGYFLGVSKEDFELFKTQAQTLLYTCRLPSCPRSSIGFEPEADISAHELEHSRHYHCQAEGCQFPSFSSFYLLEKHRKKHHHQHAEKRKLRRVNSIALST